MAKGIRLGIDGVKVSKKCWVGVEGVARKVKKIFAGIGGVKLLFSSGLQPVEVANLETVRTEMNGNTFGSYAVFSAGDTNYSKIDAYNTSLVKTVPQDTTGVYRYCGTAVSPTHLLISGGLWYAATCSNKIEAYNTSFVKQTMTGVLSAEKYSHAGGGIGIYGLFAGGILGNNTVQAGCNAIDNSLVVTSPTALSKARNQLKASRVGNYLLFVGGYDGSSTLATVDAYNTSLVRSVPTPLSISRVRFAVTSFSNYVLIAGGHSSSPYGRTDVVDAYNSSLVRTTPILLSAPKMDLAGASVGGYVLFAGGTADTTLDTVEVFNNSLVREDFGISLSQATRDLAGASVGNYALFAGGYLTGFTSTNAVYGFTA